MKTFDLNILNKTYSLAKVGNDYVVGLWVNNKLISQDGNNIKLCSVTERTKYKHFLEALSVSGGSFKVGSKIPAKGIDGSVHMYYVVMHLSDGSYIIAR